MEIKILIDSTTLKIDQNNFFIIFFFKILSMVCYRLDFCICYKFSKFHQYTTGGICQFLRLLVHNSDQYFLP